MPNPNVETAIALWPDRHRPVSVFADQAKALEASGTVDGILLADQLTNFIPRQLWNAENTPMASIMTDPDSHSDVFVIAAYLLAHAPSLNLAISTDSVRRPPAELITTMLTLANIAEGRINFQIGAGEIKQCKPFGHERSQGLGRMEDLLKIFHAFMDSDEPITYKGKYWNMHKATIGKGKPYRPKLWALGGGPKLLDYATSYFDGMGVSCPPAIPNADAFAVAREGLIRQLKDKGRDPAEFQIGIWFPVMLARDDAQLEAHIDNPLVKWMSGIFGRIDASLWQAEGLESPVPEDWNYFMKFLPYDTDQAFIDNVLDKTTREHVLKCWLSGTPAQVAEMIQPYIEAGADWVCPMDYLPLVLQPDEAEAAFGRSIELCGLIKAAQN